MSAASGIEAIQVVESRDEDLKSNGKEPKRIIKTIAKYGNGPSLEELFLSRGTKNLPILVFSITGKTRGGKSLLLNLMFKYLESQEVGGTDWLTGTIPNGFAWSGGVDSISRGLWVWPKVYVRENSEGETLGILLLDNEGMFDGEASDGEIIAMSGISTAISYLQMFNLKEKITTDNLENIVRNLVRGIEEINSGNETEELDPEMQSELQKNYRLMFVVRDWMGEKSHRYGLQGGEEYIEKDRLRGSKDNKALWGEVHKAFSDVRCLLLPHPGLVATRDQFTDNGDLKLLEQDFLHEIKVFLESLFAPDNLILPQNVLTGEDIYSLFDRVDGKVADEDLSFMNMFTDHANYIKVEKFKKEFESSLSNDRLTIEDAKSAMDDILEEAEKRLRGKSAPEHLAKLKMKTANIYYAELRKETLRGFKWACAKKEDLEGLAGLDKLTISVNFEECIDFEHMGGSKNFVYPIYFQHQQLLKDEMTGTLLEKISSLTGIGVRRLIQARKQQYEHFENFTLLSKDEADCNKIQANDGSLQKKIGYALFGCPPKSNSLALVSAGTVSSSSSSTGYSDVQEINIKKIVDKIISLNAIECSCVFLTFKQDNTDVSSPLFRIMTSRWNTQFIDSNCRVYKDFEDFIQTNTFPDVVYCYPLNGCYDKNKGFFVAFAESPASKTLNKALKVSDAAGNVVTGIAGAAGVAALAAPMVGVALPVVGMCAIVGGGIAGAYGLVRGAAKIYDKRTHKQPVSGGDILNMATNALAAGSMGAGSAAEALVATAGSMGAGSAAEALVATAIKVGQGLASLNPVATLWASNDTPDLILLLDEINDNALKILFYFNATSSYDAIKVIQSTLGMDTNSTAEKVLEKIVEINSVQRSVESKGGWKMEKYVSQNVSTLVTSLLETVSPEIVESVTLCVEIQRVSHLFASKLINARQLQDDIGLKMARLFENFQIENQNVMERVTRLVWDRENTEKCNNFKKIMSNKNKQMILGLRFLVCVITSGIRKANKFYNNIEHEAVRLPGCAVYCHPLSEVIQQIRALADQSESTSGLTSADDDQIDIFLSAVLDNLFESATPDQKVCQFANWFFDLSEGLRITFDSNLKQHQDLVRDQENVTCSHLADLFEEFEVEGNYGVHIMQNALNKVAPRIAVSSESPEVRVVPAWDGLLPRMYCYTSNQPQADKLVLVNEIKKIKFENYENKHILNNGNVSQWIFEPSDDTLSTFVVYSNVDTNGIEEGLIWFDK